MDPEEKIARGDYTNKLPWERPGKDRATYDAYYAEEARLNELFRKDMAESCGITGHPKEQMVFEKSWEHGHSSGYSEIAIFYREFAEFLK